LAPEPGAGPADALQLQLINPLLADLERRLANGCNRPLLLLNGPVGAGKSTLARTLQRQAADRGLRLAVASIDDLYLPWPERRTRLAGNPFGVWRVPPGSHDVDLLLSGLDRWRRGGPLRLPRFDKTLAGGEGDRSGWQELEAEALLLEGWLLGCRPLGEAGLAAALPQLAGLTQAEKDWLPRWDGELAAWEPVLSNASGLWLLRPQHWSLPRRWRFQAEARQRRAGGGWLAPAQLDALVRATLRSLPPQLYQDPLLDVSDSKTPPLLGAVELDGRRRLRGSWSRVAQSSPSSASSAIG
jgi:D-glycerate 3-kinase